jgi:hypothetical protein
MSAYELQPDGTLKEVEVKKADMVSVVRCKDCEYMERQTTYDGSLNWFLCSHFKRPTRCDGFCAWGVRS